MSKQKSFRRNLIEWGIIISVVAFLYFTGLYTDVIGKVQQLVLVTGIKQPDINIPPEKQENADYNLSLISFNNEIVHMKDYKDKVVFINFWASWCPPCRAEMPTIQDLYNKVKANKNIAFFMVTLDEDTAKARQFINQKGYTFPVYFLTGYMPGMYNSGTIPSTYLISKQGKVAVKEIGMADYNTTKFRNFISGLSR